jgi:trans-aconitate methyltransferase
MGATDSLNATRNRNLVDVYDSQGSQYSQAFGVFLAHTDQKAKAAAWLEREISELASRQVFVDAGAGTGKLTRALQPRFQQTIAIEPNPYLADELQKSCPGAEVLQASIAEAQPSARADFVLCSHVFYYIDGSLWLASLRSLASWLGPGGVLAVALQNPETDCNKMLRSFTGHQDFLRVQRTA